MLRTLVAAFLADACTQGTNGLGKLAATSNNGGGETANPRTIHAEGNTRGRGLGIGFLKAGDCAVFASGSTVITGFETSVVLSVQGALLEISIAIADKGQQLLSAEAVSGPNRQVMDIPLTRAARFHRQALSGGLPQGT